MSPATLYCALIFPFKCNNVLFTEENVKHKQKTAKMPEVLLISGEEQIDSGRFQITEPPSGIRITAMVYSDSDKRHSPLLHCHVLDEPILFHRVMTII